MSVIVGYEGFSSHFSLLVALVFGGGQELRVRNTMTFVIVPLPIKLELANTFPTMSECGQGSKINPTSSPATSGW